MREEYMETNLILHKLWKIFCVLLGAVGLICIGIYILREGQNQIFLFMGLFCTSFANLIVSLIVKKKK